MVNHELMWQSYQSELTERVSQSVRAKLKEMMEIIPDLLYDQLEHTVTYEGLFAARIWVADEIETKNGIWELAMAEVAFPPHFMPRRTNYTARLLHDTFAFRFAAQVDKNLKLLESFRIGKIDGPTMWERRDCPELSDEEIFLLRELNTPAKKLLRAGSLNFTSLLEVQAGAIFPILRT